MHNRDKYPAIWAEKEKAEADLAELMAKRRVHTDKMATLNTTFRGTLVEIEAERNRLNGLAMADIERIKELRSAISRCAIAMGAVVASRGK